MAASSLWCRKAETTEPCDIQNNNFAEPDLGEKITQSPFFTKTDNLATSSLLNKLIRKSLVESHHNVEVLQRDPSSPLYSVKTFEELHLKPELLHGIYAMGFNRPSKIQESALPLMLANPPQNLIAQSQSGTGKTAAFALAMLSRVDTSKKYPQVTGNKFESFQGPL
ncbi:hypothetical protein FKM82_020096 [Ascaphus truei]